LSGFTEDLPDNIFAFLGRSLEIIVPSPHIIGVSGIAVRGPRGTGSSKVMQNPRTAMKRFEDFKASKTVLFWTMVGTAIVTMSIGFGWGGWVTGGTADQMAAKAATSARAELAANLCVDRFAKGPDATAKLVSLKAIDSWKRRQVIEEGGWVTLPGTDKPVADAAELCAERLVETKRADTHG
jgi:hypothetical protein